MTFRCLRANCAQRCVIEPVSHIFSSKFNVRQLLLAIAIKSNKPFSAKELRSLRFVCVCARACVCYASINRAQKGLIK